MTDPKIVCVTGAAGQIAYSLLPMIAKGEALGPDQPVKLVLFDLPRCEDTMKGVAIELEDLASPLLAGVSVATTPEEAFMDADVVVCLAGLMAMGKDTPRVQLMSTNKSIYEAHGKAIDKYAKKTCKILVVANPDNTLALVLCRNAPSLPRDSITSMNRLDQNRAQSMIARKLGISSKDVQGSVIWGNHANSMVPDHTHAYATVGGKRKKVAELITEPEFWSSFVHDVRQRAFLVVQFRKNTSALSSATAAVNHLKDWFLGTPPGQYSSMGVYSDGSYGAPEDVFFSFPCICKGGSFQIVKDLSLTDDIKTMLMATGEDLLEERQMVTE